MAMRVRDMWVCISRYLMSSLITMLLSLAYITMHYCEVINYLYGLNICICFHPLFFPKYFVLTSILTKKYNYVYFLRIREKIYGDGRKIDFGW